MTKPAKADVPPQSGSKTAEETASHDLYLEAARRVLITEARALEGLAARLDGRFSHAVDLLAKVSGRVIVTGMGKSGHISSKIAATLASTGTPAARATATAGVLRSAGPSMTKAEALRATAHAATSPLSLRATSTPPACRNRRPVAAA